MHARRPNQVTVFVTDGDQRAALAVVRSLGRRGVSVVVGEHEQPSLASSSKYCARRVAYPSPYEHRAAFENFLVDFVARERVDVVIPVGDAATHAVARNWDLLSRHTSLATPPLAAFERVTDKSQLIELAADCGVPIPRTWAVNGVGSLNSVVNRVEYPAVVKPVRSRIPTDIGWVPANVHYAESERDIRRLYREVEYLAAYPSLIQQRIAGAGIGFFVLFDRGRLLATFSHRRLREKPPSGGVSVLSESIATDARLEEYARRMLGGLGWHGVAMMEFKQDDRTGDFFLIEVNGRFWGSLQLAIDAGVDFPYLACQLALGDHPKVSRTFRVGVRHSWLLGVLDNLLLRLRKSDRELSLPSAARSRPRVLLDFLRPTKPGLGPASTWDDPYPFFYELRQYARNWAERATTKRVDAQDRSEITVAGPSLPS